MPHQRTSYLLEPLESRVLLSGDGAVPLSGDDGLEVTAAGPVDFEQISAEDHGATTVAADSVVSVLSGFEGADFLPGLTSGLETLEPLEPLAIGGTPGLALGGQPVSELSPSYPQAASESEETGNRLPVALAPGGEARANRALASPGGGGGPGGPLDFHLGGILHLHVASHSFISSPGAGEPVAIGEGTTLSFPQLTGFPTLGVGSIELFQSGGSIDGFRLQGLTIPFSGSLTLPGRDLVEFEALALNIESLTLLNSVVTGGVNFVANGATILPDETAFSTNIEDGGNGGPALVGSINLSTGDLTLSAEKLALEVPDVLEATTSSAAFTFRPGGGLTQVLLDVGQAEVRLLPLGGVTATVEGFQVRGDGFAFGNASVALPALTVGGFMTVQTPSILLQDVGYTVGGPLLGRFGIGGLGANITLPGGLTATITDGLDLSDLAIEGGFELPTKTFSLSADQIRLLIPDLLDVSASGLGIQYNPFDGIDQPLFSFGSISIGLTPLDVAIPITGLHVRLNGFSLDDQFLPSIPDVNVGGMISLPSPSLGLGGIRFTAGLPMLGRLDLKSIGGSFSLGSGFSAAITDGLDGLDFAVEGNFDLSTGRFQLGLDQVAVSVPSVLTTNLSGVTFGYDPKGLPDQLLFSAGTLEANLIPLGVSAQLMGLDVRANGFSLGNGSVALPTVTLGGVLEIQTPTLTLEGVRYSVGEPFSGTFGLGAVAGNLTLGSGLTGIIGDGPDVSGLGILGAFGLDTKRFQLGLDQVELVVPDVLRATGVGLTLHYDPSGLADQLLFEAPNLSATLIPLGVDVTLGGLEIRKNGFSIDEGEIALPDVTIGTLARVTAPTLTLDGIRYVVGQPLQGRLGLWARSATLFPGRPYTGAVTDGTDADSVGVLGSYELGSKRFHFEVDAFALEIRKVLSATATRVMVDYDPEASADQVVATIGSAVVRFPVVGVEGTVQNLTLRPNGFHFGSASIAKEGTYRIGMVTLNSIGIQLTDFGVDYSVGARFNGSVSVFTKTATLRLQNKPISGVVSDGNNDGIGLAATFDFSDGNFGGLTFTADVLDITLSSVLELTGRNIWINATAGLGDIVLRVDSVEVRLPSLGVGGTGGGFAIRADGSLLTLPDQVLGFSFSLTGLSLGNLKWPSWMPIQVTSLGLQWPDFSLDPYDFQIVLSASVGNLPKLPSLTVSGSINGIVLDIGLLRDFKFPVISLGSVAIDIEGSLFGGTIDGSLALGMLKISQTDQIIPTADVTTRVKDRVLYGSIQAGFSFKSLVGFTIQFGLSELGPLQIYVRADRPVVLDASTGLTVTGFRGGVSFNDSLPEIRSPLQLRDAAFAPPLDLKPSEWLGELERQVLAQYKTANSRASTWESLTRNMRILAGATLYSGYASQDAFHADIDIAISTEGRFLITGTAVFANNLNVSAKLYADLSQLSGDGKVKVFFLADLPPADNQTLTIRGQLQMEDRDGVFVLRVIDGGVDLAPAGLMALAVDGDVEMTFTSTRFTLDLDGTVTIEPLGKAMAVAGRMVVEKTNPRSLLGTVWLWGVLELDTTFGGLEAMQLDVDATAILQINTSGSVRTETITLPGGTPTIYDIQPHSYRVTLDGILAMRSGQAEVVVLDGVFDMAIGASGKLSVLASGTAAIGPPGTTPLEFDFEGFFQIEGGLNPGIAGKLDIQLRSSGTQGSGVRLDFDAGFHLVFNTTRAEVRYVLPDSIQEVPGSGTSRRIVIPAAPVGHETGDQNSSAEPYFQVFADGRLTLGSFVITGSFDLLVSSRRTDLTVDGSMDLKAGDILILSMKVHGGLSMDSSGIAGALVLQLKNSSPEIAGFSFGARTTYRLEINTTGQRRTVEMGSTNVVLPQGTYVQVRIDGELAVENFDLDGYFLLTVEPKGLRLEANARLVLRTGNSAVLNFNVEGGMEWNAKGLAASIRLSLGGGQPDQDGYSFTGITGAVTLQINTTGKAVSIGGEDLEAGTYARVILNAKLALGDAFELDGTFAFSAGTNSLTIEADASLKLKAGATTFLEFDVAGEFTLSSNGIVGAIKLVLGNNGGLPSGFGELDATFQLEINSKNVKQTVRLEGVDVEIKANTYRVVATGSLGVGGFEISGRFELTKSDDAFRARAIGTVDVYGIALDVDGDLVFFEDGLAASIGLGVSGVSTDYFSIHGRLSLAINTTDDNELGIAPNTYQVTITDAELSVAKVVLSGSLTIGIRNGEFYLKIPSDDPMTLELLDRFTLKMSGEILNDRFTLTGSTALKLGDRDLAAVEGDLDVEVSNEGVSAEIDGRAWLLDEEVASARGAMIVNTAKNTYSAEIDISFGLTFENILELSGEATLRIGDQGIAVEFAANAELFDNDDLEFVVGCSIDTASGHYLVYGSVGVFIGGKALGFEGSISFLAANYTGEYELDVLGYVFRIPFSAGIRIELGGAVWVAGLEVASASASGGSDGEFDLEICTFITGCFTVHISLANDSSISKSDLGDSLVFLDVNGNGIRDAVEPETRADSDGYFNFSNDVSEGDFPRTFPLGILARYDTNANGRLDTTEGQLVFQGGVDRTTGIPLTAGLIRPASAVNRLAPVSGGEVFFDANKNGVQGAREPRAKVGPDGYFRFAPEDLSERLGSLASYDTNHNGLLENTEGRLRVQGGTITDPQTGATRPGDQAIDNRLLTGVTPAHGATRVFFDVNRNDRFDTGEPSVVPDADDFYTFLDLEAIRVNDLGRLEPFDTNANGEIDESEGRFVVVGGVDKNTGLPNTFDFGLGATGYGSGIVHSANPYSDLADALRRTGLSGNAANRALLNAFGLPPAVKLDTYVPRRQGAGTSAYNAKVLRGSEQINVLIAGGVSLFNPGVPVAVAQRAILASLASFIRGLDLGAAVKDPLGNWSYVARLDLGEVTVVRQILEGAESRLNVPRPDGQMNAAARIIAGLDRRITAIAAAPGLADLVTSLGAVKGLAETDASSAIRAVVAGSLSPASAISQYSDSEILSKLEARELPPFIRSLEAVESSGAVTTVPIRIENPNGPSSELTVTVQSDNTALLPEGGMVLSGTGNDRTLTLTPVSGARGNATVTLVVEYHAGTRRLVSTESFQMKVRVPNRAPSISPIPIQKLDANTSTGPLPFTVADPDTAFSRLGIIARSSDPSLIDASGIRLGGSGANRTLTLTPKPDQSGVAVVLIQVNDGRNVSTRPVLIQVRERRSAPTATFAVNPAADDPASTALLAFAVPQATNRRLMDVSLSDVDSPLETLRIGFVSEEPSILDASHFVVSGAGAQRSIQIRPPAGSSGIVNVDLVVSDGWSESRWRMKVTLSRVNQPPTIVRVPDQTGRVGSEIRVPLMLDDADSSPSRLLLTFGSSDNAVVSSSQIRVEGTGLERMLVVPTGPAGGIAEVTVTVSDGDTSQSRAFAVAATGFVGSPTLSAISNLTIGMNESTPRVRFVVSHPTLPLGELQWSVVSSNTSLVTSARVDLDGFGSDRSLVVTPVAGQVGVTTISVVVSDGTRSATETFDLRVEPTPFVIESWASSVRDVLGSGTSDLVISDDGQFVESRSTGIVDLRLRFSAAVDPASAVSSGVSLGGVGASGQPLDLASIGVAVSLANNDRTATLHFSRPLPDQARYTITLGNWTSAQGAGLQGDRDRVLLALTGDIDGNRSVDANDAIELRSLRSPDRHENRSVRHVRADLNSDGRITNTDLAGLVRLFGNRVAAAPVPHVTATDPLASPSRRDISSFQGQRAGAAEVRPKEIGLGSSKDPVRGVSYRVDGGWEVKRKPMTTAKSRDGTTAENRGRRFLGEVGVSHESGTGGRLRVELLRENESLTRILTV